MKTWQWIFILTFVSFYGALSISLLGSWLYQSLRSLLRRRSVERKAIRRMVLVTLTFLTLALSTPAWAFAGGRHFRFGHHGGATLHFGFDHGFHHHLFHHQQFLHFHPHRFHHHQFFHHPHLFPHHAHRGFFFGFPNVWVPGR